MKYCERCDVSLPKGQKAINDRHGRWLCQPCHDIELAEHKEKAEAHLREVKGKTGRRRNLAVPVVVGAVVCALALYAWNQRSQAASASSQIEQARLLHYRAHDASLADRVEGMTSSERETWESKQLDDLVTRLASADSALKLSETLRDNLRWLRPILAPTCVGLDGATWNVFVVRGWHGLAADEQRSAVEDIDRLVRAFGSDKVDDWVLRDAGMEVGGRRADELWTSKQVSAEPSLAGS